MRLLCSATDSNVVIADFEIPGLSWAPESHLVMKAGVPLGVFFRLVSSHPIILPISIRIWTFG